VKGRSSTLARANREQLLADFWDRLRELGWVEGQNLVIELRSADGQVERLPAIMREVIGRQLDVLVTSGTPAAAAAKNATSTVPIVVIGKGSTRAGAHNPRVHFAPS
jgi:putative tryptophan/tyrosine transport system substrate-binding protein